MRAHSAGALCALLVFGCAAHNGSTGAPSNAGSAGITMAGANNAAGMGALSGASGGVAGSGSGGTPDAAGGVGGALAMGGSLPSAGSAGSAGVAGSGGVGGHGGGATGGQSGAGSAMGGSTETSEPPSCSGLTANCGANSNEDCCVSPAVTGGSFNRNNDASYPATISSFRLDKYEVTVARFRKFVDAVVAGWRPAPGSGKHTHLNGGSGLSNSAAAGYEPGWDATWDSHLPTLKAVWDGSDYLTCDAAYATWTPSAASNENLPINCVNWYQSAAFCIWDQGFLPSDAEQNYAAAGGNEQRLYPWGAAMPSGSTALAVFGCYFNAGGDCTGFTNIAPVGSVVAGNGRYGQADLAGNMAEWNLDWDNPSPSAESKCDDCAYLEPATARVERGGSFFFYASLLLSAAHDGVPPEARSFDLGLRCARRP